MGSMRSVGKQLIASARKLNAPIQLDKDTGAKTYRKETWRTARRVKREHKRRVAAKREAAETKAYDERLRQEV